MKLENVLVEDVTLKDGEAVLNSKLYEFAGPRWISLHSGKEGQALGPVTLLKDKQPSGSEPEIVPRSFGERPMNRANFIGTESHKLSPSLIEAEFRS